MIWDELTQNYTVGNTFTQYAIYLRRTQKYIYAEGEILMDSVDFKLVGIRTTWPSQKC